MRYFLDTNICIYYLKGRFPSLRERLLATPPGDVMVSSIVEGELRFGLEKIQASRSAWAALEAFLQPLTIVGFDSAAARAYTRIRAQLESRGTLVGPNDLLIAATAIAHQAVLVTHNTAEFSRIDGLQIEDWAL